MAKEVGYSDAFILLGALKPSIRTLRFFPGKPAIFTGFNEFGKDIF